VRAVFLHSMGSVRRSSALRHSLQQGPDTEAPAIKYFARNSSAALLRVCRLACGSKAELTFVLQRLCWLEREMLGRRTVGASSDNAVAAARQDF
jgi:hypothetical protein